MKLSNGTNISGIAGIVATIANAIRLLTDGDPSTNPDWVATIAAISTAIGLLYAKNHNVSNSPTPTAAAEVVKTMVPSTEIIPSAPVVTTGETAVYTRKEP